jgi:hypothetical protein
MKYHETGFKSPVGCLHLWRPPTGHPLERALVIPCMFYSGLMMAESQPKHVAMM